MSPVLTVYSRPGCHLCDLAIAEIQGLRPLPFRLEVIDIEADEGLLGQYLERIPVIELDGEELYEFHVDIEDLGRRLEAAGAG